MNLILEDNSSINQTPFQNNFRFAAHPSATHSHLSSGL